MSDTMPPPEEEYDEHSALRTMATQVAAMFNSLPELIATMKSVINQQQEHERRIIRLEGIAETLQKRTP